MKHFIPTALFILGLIPLNARANFRDDDALAIVGDDACFVISGSKHDHNGALSRLKSEESRTGFYKFAGYTCKIFNSYKELKNHLANSNLIKNSAIFVLQVAHGGPSGTALLNAGQMESKLIAKEIRDLTENYKVAFLNQSCFGGTMILEKLSWDEGNQNSQTIDRSCLWADSLPGRVAYLDDSLPHSKTEYSFEEAYLDNPGGTLTSAAWSQAKTSEYYDAISKVPVWDLKSNSTNDILFPLAGTMMTEMNSVIQEGQIGSVPHKDVYESARFSLDTETTDLKLKTVLSILKYSPFNIQAIRQAIFFPAPSSDKCTLAVRKFLVSQWYIEFQNNLAPWANFEKNLRAGFINYQEVNTYCSDVGQNNVSSVDWAEWLSVHSSLGFEMMEYAKNRDRVEGLFRLSLSTAAFTKTDYVNKYEIATSIIGREIFKEETKSVQVSSTSSMVAGFPSMGTRGATGNVIPAFVLASSNIINLENDLDMRRRNACRSIKLKARYK